MGDEGRASCVGAGGGPRGGVMAQVVRFRLAITIGLLLLPIVAHAAGFALTEHGGRGLGSAWAGEAALGEDARTIYFNPAGMTLLHGTQIVTGMDGIRTSGTFENEGSHLSRAVGGG